MTHLKQKYIQLTFIALFAIGLTACGGGGGSDDDSSGGGGGGTTPNTELSEVLEDLGIDLKTSKRVDNDGDELPDDYSPLGSRPDVNKFSEIMLFGVPIDDTEVTDSNNEMTITNLIPGANNTFSWEVLHDEPVANTPWTDPDAKRTTTSGDFDGDGIEEVAIVYQLSGDVEMVIMDDSEANYAISAPVTLDTGTWDDVFITSGDYDGNGTIDIMLGLINPTLTSATIKMIENSNHQTFAFNGTTIDISQKTLLIRQLIMVTGNLDYDRSQELAVVVNAGGETWYTLYDDAKESFNTLKTGNISVDNGSGTSIAKYSNIALGDVDGDSIDEVILAGLNATGTIRSYSSFNYFIEVLDDKKQNFIELDESIENILLSGESMQPSSSGASHKIYYVGVITADLDDDGAKEIIVNQHIFKSLRASEGVLSYYDDDDDISNGVAKIPSIHFFTPNNRSGAAFTLASESMALASGDVTKDGRDNVVLYTQRELGFSASSGEENEQQLQVWGHDQINGWGKIKTYKTLTRSSISSPLKPQLQLPDIELEDSTAALQYSDGSHQLVFSEPLIVAALAGAPCATDLGQDLGESCRTAYGNAISNSASTTKSTNVTAALHVGYGGEAPGNNSLEVTGSIRKTIKSWSSTAYTLKKTVLYETGAIEDSVILTVIPFDVYTYKILSHPDTSLKGTDVIVSLPREPITTLVTLEFYNSIVDDDKYKIGSDVFPHITADPSSYLSAAEKNSLLNRYDGIESTEVSVGQGTGQTTATISEFTTTTRGKSYDFDVSLDVRATGGLFGGYVIGGFSTGGGESSSFEVSRGNETIYQGSVGNISTAAFNAGDDYNWGLFSYFYDNHSSGQTFEVLNYWVD